LMVPGASAKMGADSKPLEHQQNSVILSARRGGLAIAAITAGRTGAWGHPTQSAMQCPRERLVNRQFLIATWVFRSTNPVNVA
jgi:hypothetical protein